MPAQPWVLMGNGTLYTNFSIITNGSPNSYYCRAKLSRSLLVVVVFNQQLVFGEDDKKKRLATYQ